jgi:hypothetical protein
MLEVLQIEKVETDHNRKLNTPEKDTWILELPAEVCQRESFAEGTMISLTVKNGGILTSIIKPSAEIEKSAREFVDEHREFFEEMKRIGD